MDYALSSVLNCIAQGCCWYTIFSWCGVIKAERETIQTVQPIVIVDSRNPFKNPNAPKDHHLQSAYY
jgi:hypothetical protein